MSATEDNPRAKKRLLLFLSVLDEPGNMCIASTLAWLARSQGLLFDNYYDSYHQGVHFPGGDARNLERGRLTGGMVSGDRHFEEFYFLALNFDVLAVAHERTIFMSALRALDIPVIPLEEGLNVLYPNICRHLDLSLPMHIVMTGSRFGKALSGLQNYLYPEIYYRQALGVPDSIPEPELAGLCREGSRIFCLFADENVVARLRTAGYAVDVIDQLHPGDDYLSVTERVAHRWADETKGWVVGDPVLVSHWLPKACEEGLTALYSIPQERVLSRLGHLISSKGRVVYGRQYSDSDFFSLSRLDQCLQVIDPCRPPFQSVRHAEYTWSGERNKKSFYDEEYSDEALRGFAQEGRVLVSLMFWSGMIREIVNYYHLMDLFAMTGLRCGLVLTAQSYEYMMHSPFELLTVPVEQGGVFPLVEPVLGSCGIGVGIESLMTPERLRQDLGDAYTRIHQKVKDERLLPRGWWATMDAVIQSLPRNRRPKAVQFLNYPPHLQIRFDPKLIEPDHRSGDSEKGADPPLKHAVIQGMRGLSRRLGLSRYFRPYRPYEFYEAGPMRRDIIDAVRSTGLKYMFTKSGFNASPEVKYLDEDFIALNYTAGQWDGWTPFETVNDVSDLKRAEKVLLKSGRPGWIVSTMDSCLWTFGGEFWKRSDKLFNIAAFCAEGGTSKQLINVKPFTISRYARIISEKNR